jgi:hypothetical protein
MAVITAWAQTNGIAFENLDVYDMTTRPEKGDALDALRDDVALVVALHLFGMDGRTSGAGRPESWGYNRANNTWLSRCLALKIPLVCFGEQPTNSLLPLPPGAKRTQIAEQIWVYENA